jgi:hypothetical protein
VSAPIEPMDGKGASNGWGAGAGLALLFFIWMLLRIADAVIAGRL